MRLTRPTPSDNRHAAVRRRHIAGATLALLAAPLAALANPNLVLEQVGAQGTKSPGDIVEIDLSMSDLGVNLAAGFQAFLEFDTSRLEYLGGAYQSPIPGGFEPFGFIVEPITPASIIDANASGEIDLAAGVNPFPPFNQSATSDDALLVTMQFEVLQQLCLPPVDFRVNAPPTRLTGTGGDEIPVKLVPLTLTAQPALVLEQQTIGTLSPGQMVDVTLGQLNLCDTPASGYQAFLEFDNVLLTFKGGTYETPGGGGFNEPYAFVVEPITPGSIIAANALGQIDLAASINPFAPASQTPTSDDALLVTLTFTVNTELCVLPVEFRDNIPPTRFTEEGGGEILPLLIDPVDVGPPDPELVLEHGPVSQPGVFEVTLTQRNLCENEASGFQTFLGFDNLELELIAGSYETPGGGGFNEPYAFIVEPLSPGAIATANGLGEIDLAASINPFAPANQTPTSSDALLVTLQFQILGNCIEPVFFRDNIPPSRFTEEGGGEIVADLVVIPPALQILKCAPDDTISVDEFCMATVPDLSGQLVAFTDCDNLPLIVGQSPTAGTAVGFGVTPVTLTVEDGSGAMDSCVVNLTVDDLLPPTITAPADIVASPDAGGCSALLSEPEIGAPVIEDNCTAEGNLIVTFVRDDGKPLLTDPYDLADSPITITWTVEDEAGNMSSDDQLIHVLSDNELAVTVELQGVEPGPFVRCITFVVHDCDLGSVEIKRDMTFTGGIGTAILEVPCEIGGMAADYTCITAEDELHTLRRTISPIPISAGQYLADFVGADELIGGNLNTDPYVDILDFGIYAAQFNTAPGADTNCAAAGPHADISGDGFVDIADFSFININFLMFDEPDCCQVLLVDTNRRPRRAITTVELNELGLTALAAADLTGDGVVDRRDIAAFMQGARPVRPKGGHR